MGIAPDIEYPMPEDADSLAAYSMDVESDPQLAKARDVLLEKLTPEDNNSENNDSKNNNSENTAE